MRPRRPLWVPCLAGVWQQSMWLYLHPRLGPPEGPQRLGGSVLQVLVLPGDCTCVTVSLARPGRDSEKLASQAAFAAYGVGAGCAWSLDGSCQGPRAECPGSLGMLPADLQPLLSSSAFVSVAAQWLDRDAVHEVTARHHARSLHSLCCSFYPVTVVELPGCTSSPTPLLTQPPNTLPSGSRQLSESESVHICSFVYFIP